MTEVERMTIDGTAPDDNVWIDLDRDGERDDSVEENTEASVVLQGGILRVGPITNATIASMFFDGSSHSYSLAPRPGSDTILLKGRANGTTIDIFTIEDETTFEIKMTDFLLDVNSFVVPLQDMSNDDRELDDRLFGGYDDFALTGTGMVYITAWVHDIAFKPVDNMGNTLPAANTAVTLIRYNGGPITRGSGSNPDQFQSNLAWSYSPVGGSRNRLRHLLPATRRPGIRRNSNLRQQTSIRRTLRNRETDRNSHNNTRHTGLQTQARRHRLHGHNSPRGMDQIRGARRKNSNNTHRPPR
jgi:hypothetical protein